MMNDGSNILLVGLQASAVDYQKWPELSPEKLELAFEEILRALAAEGYTARWCLTDSGETAEQQLTQALKEQSYDLVLVGAGVRTDPDHFLLFEKVINLIHQHAPCARIAFNTSPFDSVEAVKRWV